MDRPAFDAFTRTLGIEDATLSGSETILPGTLVATKPVGSASEGEHGGGALRLHTGGATLPRVELAAPGTTPGSGAGFELVSVLGRGGMGVVWAARQRTLDRTVAIKRLGEAPFATKDAAALLAEARATGALEHPAIVPVHDVGIAEDGSPCLVMKRVEGTTLGELVSDDAHPAWAALERRHGDRLAATLEIVMRVADALELAHARGYVHRDVKADNVMVGQLGEVYLLDWGVALRTDAVTADTPLEIVGTPTSMAPEMVCGDLRAIDARTDVYLLGATLYHALTKRPRHRGATLPAILFAALTSEPPELGPEIPEELAALVRRATHKDPAQRPRSTAELRDALAEFLRHRASAALADRAIEGLSSLGETPGVAALGTLDATRALTEAPFGLTQALRDWPGNERAAAALDRTLGWMIDVELDRDHAAGASALARELRTPVPGLDARIREAEARAAEKEALARAARADAVERDPTRGGGARIALSAVLVAATLGLIGFMATQDEATRSEEFGYRTATFIDLTFTAIVGAVIFAARRRVFVNRWSRDAVALVFVGMLGSAGSHAIAWSMGHDPAIHGDAPTLLLFTTLFWVGAEIFTSALVTPAVIASIATAVAALAPGASLAASAITIVTGMISLAWVSRARRP